MKNGMMNFIKDIGYKIGDTYTYYIDIKLKGNMFSKKKKICRFECIDNNTFLGKNFCMDDINYCHIQDVIYITNKLMKEFGVDIEVRLEKPIKNVLVKLVDGEKEVSLKIFDEFTKHYDNYWEMTCDEFEDKCMTSNIQVIKYK